MKTPTRYIEPLEEQERAELSEMMKRHPNARTRMRAHAILLSGRKYTIDQIADIYEVDRDRVSVWYDRWAAEGISGLEERPRPGRQPILDPAEEKQAVEIVREEPRNLRRGVEEVEARLGTRVSLDTLKRVIKKKD